MSKGNVTQNLTPPASRAMERFDPRRATEFAQRSTSEQTRRALTPHEANRLLAGPDKRKAEGARDHALILTCTR
jgi:hypothetical protein